jgi:hypothetical protein
MDGEDKGDGLPSSGKVYGGTEGRIWVVKMDDIRSERLELCSHFIQQSRRVAHTQSGPDSTFQFRVLSSQHVHVMSRSRKQLGLIGDVPVLAPRDPVEAVRDENPQGVSPRQSDT